MATALGDVLAVGVQAVIEEVLKTLRSPIQVAKSTLDKLWDGRLLVMGLKIRDRRK